MPVLTASAHIAETHGKPLPVEERAGREVVIDRHQEALDRRCEDLEQLVTERNDTAEVGARIRQARRAKAIAQGEKITQADAALALGIGHRHYKRLELGEAKADNHLGAIAELFGVSVADLVGEERREVTTWTRFVAAAEACGRHPVTDQPYYTPDDFMDWWSRSVNETGEVPAQIEASTIRALCRCEVVPNARLRAAVEREMETEYLTLETIESKFRDEGDGNYLSRLLGMTATPDKDGGSFVRWKLEYETAAAIASVLRVFPQDLGI